MFTSLGDRIPIKQMIATQIEDAILSKSYLPGSKLPSENELCAQFNASRTSVREALQILSAHGLITIEKGKGIFVNKITSESVINPLEKYLKLKLDRNYVIDLVKTRQMIEPTIARDAALNYNEKDLSELKQNVEELNNCNGDYQQLAQLDVEFHQLLAKATQNEIIPLLIRPLHNMMPQLKSAVYATINQAKGSALEWHEKILNAVEARDAESAYNFMVEHLKIAEEHARKVLATHENEN